MSRLRLKKCAARRDRAECDTSCAVMSGESSLNNSRVKSRSQVNNSPDYPFNSQFTSDMVWEVLKFYDHFHSDEELISWMRSRPSGRADVVDIDGNSDIIVIIPTANVKGHMAHTCRYKIFEGLRIVFVDSLGKDPYFNYARNVNIGIRHALGYSPRWIVVSNDDMIPKSPVKDLVGGLTRLEGEVDVVQGPLSMSQFIARVGRPRLVRWVIPALYSFRDPNSLAYLAAVGRHGQALGVKAEVAWSTPKSVRQFLNALLYKPLPSYPQFVNSGSFGMYSSRLVKSWIQSTGYWLDETYINAYEDFDLSLRLSLAGVKVGSIRFEIATSGCATLGGRESSRLVRDFAGLVYFNYKLRSGKMMSNHIHMPKSSD